MATNRAARIQQPWIDAYTDNKADLQTFSSCLCLADLNADNDFKLIIADFGNGTQIKLKVYKGTSLTTEIPLLSPPSAIAALFTDRSEPRIPGIVVATGSHVLVYRNCRPYFKFTLPSQECNSLEADIWQQKSHSSQLTHLLQELSIEVGFSNLSAPSQNLLSMSPELRDDFLNKNNTFNLKKQMVITCIATMNKNISEDKDVSCLLLATESAQLFVMDPETFTLMTTFELPNVASLLCASGIFHVEYYIIFACRNGAVYLLRSGNVRFVCQLSSLPISTLLVSQSIVTANMDSTLQGFSMKGRKQWSIPLPGDVMCMTAMPISALALNLVAVALSIGSVHLYNGPHLVHSFTTSDPVSCMKFGRYGREEHALVTVASSGAVGVKLLKRTAQFNTEKSVNKVGIHPQDIKLLIPKKSKLIVEQTLREREQCKDMHAWFQRSWLGLSVVANEAYITALRNATVSQKEALKLTAQVIGLGPRMKVQIFLENMSYNVIPKGLGVSFTYDPKVYFLHQPYLPVPMLVPGIPCCLETFVTCLMPVTAQLQVVVFSKAVILSAVINMPPSAAIL